MFQKSFKSFIYAWNGLKTVWREERNFRIEAFFALLVFLCALYFKFSILEVVFSVVAVFMVLSAEIVNTAVEDICNKIEPNQDPVIGKIKDTMAAYVFVSVLGAALLGVFVVSNHFFVEMSMKMYPVHIYGSYLL